MVKVGGDVVPADFKERAQEGEVVDLLGFLHALESGRAAEEAEENGLDLVIGMMCEEDLMNPGVLSTLFEKMVPCFASCGFGREGLLFRECGDIGMSDQDGEIE